MSEKPQETVRVEFRVIKETNLGPRVMDEGKSLSWALKEREWYSANGTDGPTRIETRTITESAWTPVTEEGAKV